MPQATSNPDMTFLRRMAAALLLALLWGWLAAEAAPPGNHLEGQASAYLKRAANQPVDWHPWGREAFELARTTNRPVLLDVGATWCTWCELMDRESYTKPEMAEFINRNFVAIKVDYDADEHLAAKISTAQAYLNLPAGALPLTGFVTPAGKLYFGGSYFPPVARKAKGKDGDRPAFRDVLEQALKQFRELPADAPGFDLKLEEEFADGKK